MNKQIEDSKNYLKYRTLCLISQCELDKFFEENIQSTVLTGTVGKQWEEFAKTAQSGLLDLKVEDAEKIIRQLNSTYQEMLTQVLKTNRQKSNIAPINIAKTNIAKTTPQISACRIGGGAERGVCSEQEKNAWLKALHELSSKETLTKEQKGQLDYLTGVFWYFGLGHGAGQEKNYKKALLYFKSAKIYGNAEGINAIGNCFFYGRGTRKDEKQALGCYQLAAEKGSVDAMYNLAYCYRYGVGTNINMQMARKWEGLGKSMEQNKR